LKRTAPTSGDRELETWAEKKIFVPGDAVLVHARVTEGGEPVVPRSIRGFTENPPTEPKPQLDLAFHDDGHDGDALAGDRVYTARVAIDDGGIRKWPGPWGFKVLVTVGEQGEPIEAHNAFLLFGNDVVLTGKYRDALEDGSLAVYVGVKATRATMAQVRGELHGPRGEDIAWANANGNVPAGESELRLLVYGKQIHDTGIDGPYLLTHVVLANPTQKLIGPEATDVAHTTQPYRARDFRDDAFNASNPICCAWWRRWRWWSPRWRCCC
jgi:hypothetical protein